MGHIELAAPVSHIWYFRGVPSRISTILNMSPKQVEQVIYFAAFVVLDPGETGVLQEASHPRRRIPRGDRKVRRKRFQGRHGRRGP